MSQSARPGVVTSEYLPPQSLDAERAVLGSMLRDNRIIGDILQIIRKEDYFYDPAHRAIFRAIVGLYDHGQPADLVTVSERLYQEKLIEDVGGYAYLASLWEATPTAAHAEHHARIVRDKAIIRDLIRAANEILTQAYEQNAPADDLLEDAERKILQIAEWGLTGQTFTLEECIAQAYSRIDQRHQRLAGGAISGLSTGFLDLDEKTAGLQDSELIIIAARPSMGKTAFALNIARHVALEEDKAVFFVSLEQSRIELAERLLCCQARIDSHKLRKGHLSAEEMRRLHAAGNALSTAKFFIDDTPAQDLLRIAANARRLKLRHNIRLLIIDYLQLIEPDSRSRRESRQEQVAAISRRLKHLAKELQLPVVACAQLNRGPEDRADNRPRLSDLRESGAIEQDADTVFLLHRPDYYNPEQDPGVLEVIIAKQRNGPTGDVRLAFLKPYLRMENLAPGHPFE
ncbi:MAG: replicative DNA helicase [Gemmatales bacterium]|nr:replicative DNA helicase [Gemmatales bacterium]MDW7994067.1 replicative DNA helicase [Gemmatales bacterium]